VKPKEAIKKAVKDVDYKFIASLLPPLIYMSIASAAKGLSHGEIAIKVGLAITDYSKEPPFKVIKPNNFKAGKLLISGSKVKISGISDSFSGPNYSFKSDSELQAFFDTADITFVKS